MNANSEKKGGQRSANSRVVPERRYSKPPVIEALCEIYFSDSSWDDTIPGAFYERIKADYPKKQQKKIQEAKITMGPNQAVAGVRQLPPWMQFVSDEKCRMIQLAENLLVVNQLHPYPHFEEWEPEIYRSLRIYKELASPREIMRLGLRYINRIVIPKAKVQMEHYFTIYPKLPEGLGDSHGSFVVRVEVPQVKQEHTVLITFGTAPLPEKGQIGQAFMLDLYDIMDIKKDVDDDVLKAEVRRAHNNIIIAFEDSITDRLRRLFEEEQMK